MKILWIILGLLGLFIIVTLIRAVFFKEKKQQTEKLLPEMINMEKYCQDLSDAIKIKTISNYDRELVDWAEFEKFHLFLEERFPLVHKTMTRTKVADASLVYKWEGTDPSLAPPWSTAPSLRARPSSTWAPARASPVCP